MNTKMNILKNKMNLIQVPSRPTLFPAGYSVSVRNQKLNVGLRCSNVGSVILTSEVNKLGVLNREDQRERLLTSSLNLLKSAKFG